MREAARQLRQFPAESPVGNYTPPPSRPALYADALPPRPVGRARLRWPNLRWAALQLLAGMSIAAIVGAMFAGLWR